MSRNQPSKHFDFVRPIVGGRTHGVDSTPIPIQCVQDNRRLDSSARQLSSVLYRAQLIRSAALYSQRKRRPWFSPPFSSSTYVARAQLRLYRPRPPFLLVEKLAPNVIRNALTKDAEITVHYQLA